MARKKTTRREFLKASGAVGLSFMVLPRRILGGKAHAS
ncbi:MAG: twin-arginine translocation signal domain-containing protein, partial [Candidatus Hydrogenedens sp.]